MAELRNDGSSSAEIKHTLHPRRRIVNTNQDSKQFCGYASMSYQNSKNERIGGLVTDHRVKIYFKPMQKVPNILRSTNDPQDLYIGYPNSLWTINYF